MDGNDTGFLGAVVWCLDLGVVPVRDEQALRDTVSVLTLRHANFAVVRNFPAGSFFITVVFVCADVLTVVTKFIQEEGALYKEFF